MQPPPPPLEAFAAYLRRRLAEEGLSAPAVVTLEDDPAAARGADVALVAGVDPEAGERLAVFADGAGLGVRFVGPGFAVLDRFDPLAVGPPPPGYRVLAVVTTFNEEDIIGGLLDRLLADGIEVHVIDNWSSDGTVDLVRERIERAGEAGGPRLTLGRFPADRPSSYFELAALLTQVQEVAHRSGADWVIHHDADEVREPPWPGVGLRQALYAVDRFGFNCADHTVANFAATDDTFSAGEDLVEHFGYFEFGDVASHFLEQKAWKPQDELVEIASTGGHEARFAGRRVFPYKFLLRHYPIRSQAHGERKIFRERRSRFHPAERARGWHIHYDLHPEGTSFLRDPASLLPAQTLEGACLLQRLSGAGLAGNPNAGEGAGERFARRFESGPSTSAPDLVIALAVGGEGADRLALGLRAIGEALRVALDRRPGLLVDLELTDEGADPALAVHQLEALHCSLAAAGLRRLTYTHGAAAPTGAADEQRAELVVALEAGTVVSPPFLLELLDALTPDVAVVLGRRLPVEERRGDERAGGYLARAGWLDATSRRPRLDELATSALRVVDRPAARYFLEEREP